MVAWSGIEPLTRGFSVLCSTNWAIKPVIFAYIIKKWRPGTGSNRRPLAWQASVLTNWTTGPKNGGRNRARTYDLLLVRQMLSQLSYAPISYDFLSILNLLQIVNTFFEIFKIFFSQLGTVPYCEIYSYYSSYYPC